jgi:hypothetical protein
MFVLLTCTINLPRYSLSAAAPKESLFALLPKPCARTIVSVERQAEILEELGAVGDNTGAILVKDRDRRSPGLAGVLIMSGVTEAINTAFATRFVP